MLREREEGLAGGAHRRCLGRLNQGIMHWGRGSYCCCAMRPQAHEGCKVVPGVGQRLEGSVPGRHAGAELALQAVQIVLCSRAGRGHQAEVCVGQAKCRGSPVGHTRIARWVLLLPACLHPTCKSRA